MSEEKPEGKSMSEEELYENIYRIMFERDRSFLEISAEANEIAERIFTALAAQTPEDGLSDSEKAERRAYESGMKDMLKMFLKLFLE